MHAPTHGAAPPDTSELTFGSVCSGIEAASVAWEPLGLRPMWLSEIEPFACSVLAHRFPRVRNLGDMTAIAAAVRAGTVDAPDVLVGGPPCQAYSVAGLRGGLSDPRGALTLAYVDLANAIDTARSVRGLPPAPFVYENVFGILSSHDNAFGCFLAGLVGEDRELEPEPRPAAGRSSRRWRWNRERRQHTPVWPNAGCVSGPQRVVAWRLFDAQHFASAQQRRRVFVVGCDPAGGFDPLAVLFEYEGTRVHRAADQRGEGEGERVRRSDLATTFTRNYARGVHCGGETYIQELSGRVRRVVPLEVERIFGFPDDWTNVPRKVVRELIPDGSGPCAKQTVTATVVASDGTHYVGTNHQRNPVASCPRAGMPTGTGYELCRNVCQQSGHAEVNALRLAGKAAKGATLYVEGHTYACAPCSADASAAGIVSIEFGPPPGTALDTERYRALGNSMNVGNMRWLGGRVRAMLARVNA